MFSLPAHHSPRFHQRGIATLFTSVIILFLATVLIITVSRTTLMEQRMSANAIRHKQAFEAAQEGLDQAMAYLTNSDDTSVDKNGDGAADTLTPSNATGTPGFFATFCEPGSTPICPDSPGYPTCGAITATNFTTPLVASCGWSDDRMARQLIQQGIGTVAAIGTPPTNPLTAKGSVSVSGSANVVNYFNNLTIWSGAPLESIGNSGKTFIRNPTLPPPPAGTIPPGEPNACSTSEDYICTTDKNTIGPDVITSDPTLSNLTSDQMFTNYFGQYSLADYIRNVDPLVTNDPGLIAGKLGSAIVLTGNPVVLPNATMGSREQPVVLIIDGDLSLQGTPEVYGIVYVRGDVYGGGNLTVMGGMATEGSVGSAAKNMTGSIDIIYDPLVTSNASEKIGKPGWIAGSWRDW